MRGTHREILYELMWETHEGLRDMLTDRWDAGPLCTSVEDMQQKLSNLAKGVGKQSRDTFGSVRKETKQHKQVLVELRSDPLHTGPSHAELKVKERPIEIHHREEIMWG